MTSQIVVAQWDFAPEQPDELNVSAGQRLKVLEQAEEWFYAQVLEPTEHNLITKGYIPTVYCEPEQREDEDEDEEEEGGEVELPPPSVEVAEAQLIEASAGLETREAPRVVEDLDDRDDLKEKAEAEADESFQVDASYSPKPADYEIDEAFQVDVSPAKARTGRAPPPPPPPSPMHDISSSVSSERTSMLTAEANDSIPAPKLNSPREAVPSEDDLRSRFEELKQQAEAIRLIDPTELNLKTASAVQPTPPPPPPPPPMEKKPLPVAPPPPPPPSVASAHKKLLEKRLQQKELEELRTLELRKAALQQEVDMLERRKSQSKTGGVSPEAERQKREKLAEESRRRAKAERDKRLALEEAQRLELEREYEELKAVGVKDTYVASFAHKDHRGAATATHTLNDAVKLVKQAVSADNQKRFTQAYGLYSNALDAFVSAINGRKVSSKTLPRVIEGMKGYVMRLYTLEKSVCKGRTKRKGNMVEVLTVMTNCGFDPVPNGDELYLEGRLSETTGKVNEALCAYTQALEYMMAFHHACKAQKKSTRPDVLEKIGKMLDKAEKLKRSSSG